MLVAIKIIKIGANQHVSLALKFVILIGHVNGPTEFVALCFVVDFVDGYVVFLTPGKEAFVSVVCLRENEERNLPGHRYSWI